MAVFMTFGNSIKLCDPHYYQGIPRGHFRLKLCSERKVFFYWPGKLKIALISSFNWKVYKFELGIVSATIWLVQKES